MTIHNWLKQASKQMEDKQISSANIDSHLILAHCLGKDKSFLLSHGDDELESDQEKSAHALLDRRLNFEPMAFLLGEREFFNITLKTDDRALIPRGETEVLVETALECLKKQKTPQLVVEVGTGAGGIICALAKNAPGHTYIATELSEEALALAKENAEKLGIKTWIPDPDASLPVRNDILGITFLQGDLCAPLNNYTGKINLLVANLPYISEDLLTVLDPTVQYFEPHLALSGGSDGLDIYRDFIPQTKELLSPDACMIVEHEFDQGEAMRQLLLQTFPTAQVENKPDFSGHDRITILQLR